MITHCPQCGEDFAKPSPVDEYCSNCGWPDEKWPREAFMMKRAYFHLICIWAVFTFIIFFFELWRVIR